MRGRGSTGERRRHYDRTVFPMAPFSSFALRRARNTRRTPLARILLAPLVAVAMLLSLTALATPAGATVRIARSATELDYSRAVMHVLNAERRAHGLPALRGDH